MICYVMIYIYISGKIMQALTNQGAVRDRTAKASPSNSGSFSRKRIGRST